LAHNQGAEQEAAGCSRSSIAEAIKALESCGILSWAQRIKRVREACPDLLGADGWRWRVLRTSNAYYFRDPGAPGSGVPSRNIASKSEKPTGTRNQALNPVLAAALGRLQAAQQSDSKGGRRQDGEE
jgi:hypothetical protein